MQVVKVGGSLTRNGRLGDCLARIAHRYPYNTIVVPGGGTFADQVRLAQQEWHFNEVAAHRMAILAMQQMALLFNALQPDWPLVKALDELKQPSGIGIWFPDFDLLEQYAIPSSWDITSDSLAAWLAGQLSATELHLIKSANCPNEMTLEFFIAQGILDSAFLNYSRPNSYKISVVNVQDFLVQT